ncbi:MAG: flagellin N-terminal helical domain-containing protein [Phycisphaerae bacterium]
MSRIMTNVSSLVAARILDSNNKMLTTSLERLSTGYRINRGKDDPAGLIASETLRGEIAAIKGAMDNTKRADMLISVAEGGLQEISNLLVELESLVDTTANKAALGSAEIEANQLQIDSILDTINRISTSTEFEGKKLLNGTLDYTTSGVTIGPSGGSAIAALQINSARIPPGGYRTVTVQVTTSAQTARVYASGTAIAAGGVTLQISGKYGVEQFSFGSGTGFSQVANAINQSKALTGVSATFSAGTSRLYFNSTDYGSDAFVTVQTIQGTTMTVSGGDSTYGDHGADVGLMINGAQAVTKGLDASLHTTVLDLDLTLNAGFAQQTALTKTFYINGGGADFSIAPTLGLNATASLGIQNVATGNLGKGGLGYLSSLGRGQDNDMASGNFAIAQRIIRQANEQISSLRGRLGAFSKNTLTSAYNALAVALENTSAAESAIRDTDFARETSQLTRAQILVNAATSTLQLANAQPRNVLALLGG